MITIIKRHGFGTARTHFTKIKRQSVNSISHLTLSELICVRNKYRTNMKIKNLRLLPKTTSCMTVDGGPMRGVAAMTAKCSGPSAKQSVAQWRKSSSRKRGTVAGAARNQPLYNTEQRKTLNQIVIFHFL